MDIIKEIIGISSNIVTQLLFFISLYYMATSVFGIIRKIDKRKVKPEKSFALLVAAHNEETVVKDIVHSLKRLDYPKELYDIFVIADNCTDNTAAIARNNGAIVYERTNKEKRGKGYALEWMFEKIFKMEKKYDSVVVFDADNLVSKAFLTEMNKALCSGYKVVQGYLDSKNPNDTWITGSYSISFWTSNRIFQLSRSKLGLSNQLGGTGFCISLDTLKELGWGATCLTEDLEFTCKLVLNGYKVGWAHDAVIYDEKPLTLQQSWWQRKRWMQGFADVASRYFWRLMKRAIKKRDIVAFDCAIYSIQPFILILVGLGTLINLYNESNVFIDEVMKHGVMDFLVIKIASITAGFSNISNNGAIEVLTTEAGIFSVLGTFVIVMQLILTPIVLILEKKLSLRVFWFYIIYPIYFITWFPISIQGIIDRNKKEWSHTLHTRSVNITDLEKVN